MTVHRKTTVAVDVGGVVIGGGAPIVVQAMTDTDTTDAAATARQCRELADAGAELVRIAVASAGAAAAVPEIRHRLDDDGCSVPLVGDFHFNGHTLLRRHPECARALAKYRINPGTSISPEGRDAHFQTICGIARDHGAAIRIGVNGGSLDRRLVTAEMERNARRESPLPAAEVLVRCAVTSALRSLDAALAVGLGADRVVLSAKVSAPPDLIRIYRRLAGETRQPLHLGLTEAGMGTRGLVWSAAALGPLLHDGIGDTIRVSLTPRPGGDRCDEVVAARELLQSLALRSFAASVTSCPGCGRTEGAAFRALSERVDAHLRRRMPAWRSKREGVESLRVAVMGCTVNGPGESKTADIGISLPGAGERPSCPVFVNGELHTIIGGDPDEVAARFLELIDEYVDASYPVRSPNEREP